MVNGSADKAVLVNWASESYQWVKLEISGTAPTPRSGCQMTINKQGKIVIYGGYSKSKVKKDVEKGIVHTDMFFLAPQEKPESAESDESAKTPLKWKWVQVRQSGDRPSPRSGFSLLPFSPAPSGFGFGRALLYGGVCDDEEDDETLESVFYNDMYTVDLENGKWYELYLKGEKAANGDAKKSRRRKAGGDAKKDEVDAEDGEEELDEEEDEMEEEENGDLAAKKPKIDEDGEKTAEQPSVSNQIFDDGIFTVSIGAADGENDGDEAGAGASSAQQKRIAQSASAFVPEARMNAQMVLKNNVAYLYGGMKEDGDKTLTLRDFYSLDLSKLDSWRVIARDEKETKEWAEMSESSEEEEEEDEGAEGGESDEDDEEDAFDEFWEENRARFIDLATKELEESGQSEVTKKMIKNRAFQLAKEEFGN